MNIEEIKEALREADRNGIPIDGPHTIIRFLLAECQKWQELYDYEYRERKKYKADANYFSGEVDRLTAELAEKDAEIADLRESISRAADAWIECTGYPYPACAEININKLRRELAEAQNIAAGRLEVVEKRGKELLAIHKALSGNVNDPDPLHSSPYCLSYPTTYGLVAGIIRERDKLRNLAASRLADQEAIERHVTKRVATECLSIMEASETYEDAVEEIKERYEVG